MMVVHLTASRFYGGPERQILGLARSLPAGVGTTVLSFAEGGACQAFLEEARRQGIAADQLMHDTPRLWAAVNELTVRLRQVGATVLCCHGYKADLVGQVAARWLGVPAIAVARGWTGESRKVRLYEALDRYLLRGMQRVVCVSAAQARKVRQAGVAADRIVVIRNAIHVDRFAPADSHSRQQLQRFFTAPKRLLVGTAGRLSPEKGFAVLLPAAAEIVARDPSVGFLWFGAGPLQASLAAAIAQRRLQDHVILTGFRDDLDRLLPSLDLFVLPSFTEGLPNVVLEAMAAAVPVVATAAGGTPEVVLDGVTGYLVPVGDSAALARQIRTLLQSPSQRYLLGQRGRNRVEAQFSFAAQARQYHHLFQQLRSARSNGSRRVALAHEPLVGSIACND